jgi:hypothetical protein
MKKNPPQPCIVCSVYRRFVPLVIAVAAALAQPAFASAVDHDLQFIENSPTSLTVTYDASPLTVFPSVSDAWGWALPSVNFVATTFSVQWAEPESSSLVNYVTFGTAMTREGFVMSDVAVNPQLSVYPNGTPVQVGTDGGINVYATFTDNAAAAETPDTGSSVGLLFLALTALFGASHLRSL